MPAVLNKIVEAGMLGKKVGKGFYATGKRRRPNRAMQEIIAAEGFQKQPLNNSDIVDRLLLGMVNEASLCLAEGVVTGVDQLDMAMIMGIGFPPFRGGLLRYADEIGIDNVVARLQELTTHFGERFTPSGYLLEMQKSSRSFFEPALTKG